MQLGIINWLSSYRWSVQYAWGCSTFEYHLFWRVHSSLPLKMTLLDCLCKLVTRWILEQNVDENSEENQRQALEGHLSYTPIATAWLIFERRDGQILYSWYLHIDMLLIQSLPLKSTNQPKYRKLKDRKFKHREWSTSSTGRKASRYYCHKWFLRWSAARTWSASTAKMHVQTVCRSSGAKLQHHRAKS